MVARIVSLVPSLTELCFDLGLGPQLRGRTDYCIAPADRVEAIPSMGGPKSVDASRLAAAHPTHVLVSPEENLPGIVPMAEALGAEAVIVHPLAPTDNLALFRRFGTLFDCDAKAATLAQHLESALDHASACAEATPRLKVLPLIWKDPWVTASPGTYVAAMLAAVGLDTVGTGDALYPRLDDLAAAARRVDWILPTTEPYPFDGDAIAALKVELRRDTVALVDGEAVAWYGSRAIRALPLLSALKRRLLDSARPRS
jgi:ABC-type Fe3+-hydroxamate transport system substrate-binding protein